MFLRKRVFTVMAVGALLGASAHPSAQASAAHGRVAAPLAGQYATLPRRTRRRRIRRRLRMIVWRQRPRMPGAGAARLPRTTGPRRRRSLGSFARAPPRAHGF
jgi:hypothetical protein